MFVIILIVLGLLIVYYLYQIPKEEIEERELKRKQPVIVELVPRGTRSKPVKCNVNDTIYFKAFGYSDYKKQEMTELEGSNITWHTIPQGGIWEKEYGIENTYYAPNIRGYRDIWINYRDKKIKTSSKCKILVR